MRAGDPINSLAMSLTRALDTHLPDIEYEQRGEVRRRRPMEQEVSVHMFPQTWGSTALGFGGVGGQAMTSGDVVVITCNASASIYFAGRHAYTIDRYSSKLLGDIALGQLVDVGGHAIYESEGKPHKKEGE